MRGKGSKLGDPCPKVRSSQDRMPIEPSFSLSLSLWPTLCQCRSCKCRFAQMSLNPPVESETRFYHFQGNVCCAYGTSGLGTQGYDCLMIPGASSVTTLAPKPNSYCGAAFVTLGGSVGVSTFANTQTVCSKLQKTSWRR